MGRRKTEVEKRGEIGQNAPLSPALLSQKIFLCGATKMFGKKKLNDAALKEAALAGFLMGVMMSEIVKKLTGKDLSDVIGGIQ